MLASAIPTKIPVPWATSGDKVVVPIPSQIAITDGRASFTTGFPPLNATPLSAGGVAPFWTDFNGLLNQITAVQQWQCAGGIFKYDSAFSTAIGGYPKYCVLMGTTGVEYLNLVDNNTTDPDSLGAANWGSRQGVTPNQFDDSQKLATTAAVRRAVGSYRGTFAYAVNTVLTAAHVSCKIVAANSASANAFTMPDPTTLINGATITIENLSGFPLNIVQATVSDRFLSAFDPSGSATSYNIPNFTEATFVAYQGSVWLVGGTADFSKANFKSSLTANGWRALPDGSIEQWGVAAAGSMGSPATFSFPVPFPNQCFQIVASQADAASTINAMAADSPSLSTFRIASASGSVGVLARWRAVGN